jgi:acyl carrier protein
METVAQKTKRIIADTLGVKRNLLTYESHLQHDLGADSLDVLAVIGALEKEFGVPVNDEKIERMKCVGDLIKHFEQTKFIPLYHPAFQAA